MKLNDTAQRALDDVTAKHVALKMAKAKIEAELRLELEKRLSAFTEDRNLAVRLADDLGVPRTQVGRALGTSNYKTVQDILDQTPSTATAVESAGVTTDARWSVVDTEEGTRLSIFNLGVPPRTGSAIVAYVEDEIIWVDGDEFVVPQIYRNGLDKEVVEALN